MHVDTTSPYRNNCFVPFNFDLLKVMYLFKAKPVGKEIQNDMINAAICGEIAINPKSTSSFFRIKL